MQQNRNLIITAAIFISGAIFAQAELPANIEKDTAVLKTRMIPQPKTVTFAAGAEVIIDRNLKVKALTGTGKTEDAKCIAALFKTYWQCSPKITVEKNPQAANMTPDGYNLNASEGTMTITAADFNGIRNALRTIRQIAEAQRGVKNQACFYIPEIEIKDVPSTAFRGIHICWFPESNPKTIEKAIHLAAYYKFNYLVLEPWGVFPYKSHPELTWKDKGVPRGTFKNLVKTAREQGITMIPQLNIFGHAAAARHISGKHAVLDFNPSVQSLFEPCHSNPHVQRQSGAESNRRPVLETKPEQPRSLRTAGRQWKRERMPHVPLHCRVGLIQMYYFVPESPHEIVLLFPSPHKGILQPARERTGAVQGQ